VQLLTEGWVREGGGAGLEEAREGELVGLWAEVESWVKEIEGLGEIAVFCMGKDEGVGVLGLLLLTEESFGEQE